MNPNLTAQQLRKAAKIKEQIESLERELSAIFGGSVVRASAAPSITKPKRKMSAAGRARIVAAQKARWAKVKNGTIPAPAVGRPSKAVSQKPASKSNKKAG